MKTILSLAAGVSMLALTSIAGAQEPIKLTDGQMDRVTAGQQQIVLFFGAAIADAGTTGYGNVSVAGFSNTLAVADPTGVLLTNPDGNQVNPPGPPNAYAHADAGLTAVSGYFVGPGSDKNGAFSYESTAAFAQLQ